MRIIAVGLALVALSLLRAHADGQLEFEKLGIPATVKELSFSLVTQDPDGYYIAWTRYEGPLRRALLGVRLDTGEMTWVDVGKYGFTHIVPVIGRDGNIYLYTGNPAHFLRYDITKRELVDLGCPAKPANYFGGGDFGADGKFYVGSYPATYLVSCDTNTGEIESLGRIAEDPLECYIYPSIAISDDGVVYCPVGLHHRELWAYDTRTDTKQQILPEELTEAQGCPTVWLGKDGQVYGKAGSARFLCQPDRIVTDATILGVSYHRRPPVVAGDRKVGTINAAGKLSLTDIKTGEETLLQTDYGGKPLKIFCVGPERGGKVWGGTLFPAMTYSYDIATGEITDHGRIATGSHQIYDIINLPQGLLMGSYFGAWMDLWDPDKPLEQGVNPYRFERNPTQERPIQWAMGPDGCAYVGTVPSKGRLGGALVRTNPADRSIKWWDNIVANQSIMYCAPVPATGEMFCVTSIGGGSSAKATEKEACAFLWDCAGEKIVHTARPIPGATGYGRVVTAKNGIVYGLAGAQYYAFDPVKRETVFVGDLPVKGAYFPGLSDEPVGEKGLIYGLGEDAVFAIDPADHSAKIIARHESIKGVHGFHVTADGVLYYGAETTLWRCKLLP